MYSNNQWSFNPAVYQNIPYEQVDWASLAQQWIKMKETAPATTQGPAPPPAPVISKTAETPVPTPTPSQPSNDIEGGEAPMDMDTKDDEATTPPVGAATTSGNWNQWGNWQSQWGWGWSGNSGSVPSTDSTPSATSNVDSKVKSTNNDSIAALNDVRNFPLVGNSTTTTQVSSTFNYNNTGGTVIPPIIPKSNYSFNNAFPPASKHSSDNWHKGGKSSSRQPPQKSIPQEQFPVLDAAKKKQLPAWIREGLTKMEREKQKKMERERMVQEKYIMDQIKSEHAEPEPAPIPAYVEEPQPTRDPPPAMPDYAHRYSPDPAQSSKYQKRRSPSIPRQRSREPQALRKTKDQIMEESMLKVRRILTEILLEATEKQVHLIAKEEHRRYRPPASAPQIRKSNALSSLTGNLGLDVYDSEDNSSDGERDRDDDIDSDEELKMTIEKKKRDFTLVEDEIERLIEDQEARERLIAQRDSKDEDDFDDEGNEDDEEDEPRARNSRDKADTGGSVSHHQRYPDHDRDRQYPNVESRSVDDDRNDYRGSTRRNLSSGGEPKQINGDTKPGPVSIATSGPCSPTTAPVEELERSKKDSSAGSSSSSSARPTSKSHHSTKRSSHRSRSSSSSSSSSASSSSSSSPRRKSRSSTGDDDDSVSGGEPCTDDGKSKRSKGAKNRKSRRSDTAEKSSSKRSKRRSSDDSDSGSRKSSSRSRYHDAKSSSSSGKRTSSRNTDSTDRSRRRRSPSYRRRSPSYRRSSSRREHSSKYKDSPSSSSSRSRRRGDDYSPESKRSRYRSSSRESSRYKRR